MKEKRYPILEEEAHAGVVNEPVLATAEVEEFVLPDDVPYAHIVDGILQVSPDIEDEISRADSGEVISMGEFKNMFARWLD